jgi:hypothetical protein
MGPASNAFDFSGRDPAILMLTVKTSLLDLHSSTGSSCLRSKTETGQSVLCLLMRDMRVHSHHSNEPVPLPRLPLAPPEESS